MFARSTVKGNYQSLRLQNEQQVRLSRFCYQGSFGERGHILYDMLFNSIEYLLFLPTVFLIYWQALHTTRSRNIFLIAASYLFYGWWSWKFLVLIFITTLLSWYCGQKIGETGNRIARRGWLSLNIAANLGILAVYKYFNFFADNFALLLRGIGLEADAVTLNLVLPVGISFYTFQALSYTIDVYRRDIKPERDVAAFFAFISFFPQLVAGPIERATNLLPQFKSMRTFSYAQAVEGLKLILWGLFKKMLLADNCANVANIMFDNYQTVGSLNLWWGAVAFSFQIYGDFSGYSDMAIGSAKLLGIDLMKNFDKPYFSRSIPDFWRRWHISLQTWFRDYVYFPLGGSRRGKKRTAANTVTVFLLSGLWHGANWTYICWGFYHAILFIPRITLGKVRIQNKMPARIKPFAESTAMASTFMLVCVGWVIFRSQTLHDACAYIGRMFTDFSYTGQFQGRASALAIVLLATGEILCKKSPHPFHFPDRGIFAYRSARWAVYTAFYIIIIMFAGGKTDFIYFQF